MDLLTARHLARSFSEKTLLTDVDIIIHEGEKTGLVGVNGSGKSTLLKILAGVLDADRGEITRSNELRIGCLPQVPEYRPELTVMEQACRYAPGAEEYELRALLNRLGLDRYDSPMGTLSGGQRKKVALAALLAERTNLLLLDEPTNHMDHGIIEWMEERLISYRGAILMVTHDRYFLERVCGRICEIEKGRLVSYEGNYDAYLTAKADRLQMAMASERKRAAIYKKELRWIRWSAPARTTKARGRIQRFHQLEEAKQTFEDPQLELTAISSRLGREIIEIDGISMSYEGEKYIDDFSYRILRNDRIGIVGPNGCGKTTLLRLLMGQEQPEEGRVKIGQTVKLGYFAQESEPLDDEVRLIRFVEDIASNVKTADGYLSASQMLEKFLFPAYMHSVKIGKLSGGEKRRLYLLSVLMQAPNVLLLDEPTNDLDIDTLTVLEDYLDTFPGAVVIVSHDRYFLDRLVIRTFAFEEGGRIGHYTGGYSKYMNEKEAAEGSQGLRGAQGARGSRGSLGSRGSKGNGAPLAEETSVAPDPIIGIVSVASGGGSGEAGGGAARSGGRKLRFSYNEKREFESIEEEIEDLELRIAEVEAQIAASASDYEALTRLASEKEQLEEQLLQKMDRWEYLSELDERIRRGETVQ